MSEKVCKCDCNSAPCCAEKSCKCCAEKCCLARSAGQASRQLASSAASLPSCLVRSAGSASGLADLKG